MPGDKIPVEIYGRRFEIDAEGLTPIEASALAQAVSARMEETAQVTGIVDSSKLAVLTALNLAYELSRLRKEHEDGNAQFLRRVRTVVSTLEEALK